MSPIYGSSPFLFCFVLFFDWRFSWSSLLWSCGWAAQMLHSAIRSLSLHSPEMAEKAGLSPQVFVHTLRMELSGSLGSRCMKVDTERSFWNSYSVIPSTFCWLSMLQGQMVSGFYSIDSIFCYEELQKIVGNF